MPDGLRPACLGERNGAPLRTAVTVNRVQEVVIEDDLGERGFVGRGEVP